MNASLVCRNGARAGVRFALRDGVTKVGRGPDNDAVIDGLDAGSVSLHHCEIVRQGDGFLVRDAGSTNGTWVDGERVTEAPLTPSSTLRLGQQGPEFGISLDEGEAVPLDRTIEMPAAKASSGAGTATHEEMLSAAVREARRMREHGFAGQTMTIMRDVLEQALRHTRRRHRRVWVALAVALLVLTGTGIWRIASLARQKRAIDAQIRELEVKLQNTTHTGEADRLVSSLDEYQEKAESLQRSLLYRIGPHDDGDFVTRELRAVMAEFGAEVYSIPPDFDERVHHYIEKDTGSERPKVKAALVDEAGRIKTIRRMLQEAKMPPDLAYIPIVEGALTGDAESAAGAAGPWQMTAPTARAYGLRVEGGTDERKDLVKSTAASCAYLKDLILDFGAGSSVMLALAAYNGGAGKVKQAVNRNVRDPIQQRNFWYLYRTHALPVETSEYVPKVFAAILIGRNPKHFGF